ncbi:type II toxin-antitoxin system RelE family toxin [Halovivax asiaticus]|uniref:type II toxin-antitoxin system RelE family toxin n=1 Tax=Halovivax asiaticus TaxID=332953 RepID=UPI001266F4A0|nr:hypothetical protein [Halovivax asiaticus]
MSEGENFEARQQPKFERDYKKLNKQGKGDSVIEGVQGIVEDPKGNSTRLKGEYEGKRKHRNDPIRIVFSSCPECIERDDMEHNACADCEDLHGENQEDPQKIIKLFETGERENFY